MWFHGVQKDFNNVFHGISKDIELEDTDICFTYLGVQTGDDFYGFNHAYTTRTNPYNYGYIRHLLVELHLQVLYRESDLSYNERLEGRRSAVIKAWKDLESRI